MESIRSKFNCEYVHNLIKQVDIENIDTVVPVMGGFTLLHIAAFNNDEKLVDYLLRKKADVNSRSKYWGTALHIAVIMENLGIIEILINYGADVNTLLIQDSDLIHYLYRAEPNLEENPEFLLQNHAIETVMLETYDFCFGKSPLQIAVDRGNEKIVELLLKNNADPNLDTHHFETPLICAITKENLPIMELLLAYGADVNSVSESGFLKESPLHIAVQSQSSEAVELILTHSMVNINIVTAYKYSALHYAFFATDDNIIRQLLNAGVDINLKNASGKTAFALQQNHSQKVKDIITEYIAKLSATNCSIDKENLAVVDSGKFGELRGQCISEIEKLKMTYIGKSNVTFYNVLCNKCEHKLALSLKYVSDSFILNLNIESFFPLYGGMIAYRLRKALGRKKLLSNAISVIDDIFNDIQLPSTFTRSILKLLTNKDLEKLQ